MPATAWFFYGFNSYWDDVVSEDLIAILLSSVLVGAGVVVARFFREASLLAATFLVGFIGLELMLGADQLSLLLRFQLMPSRNRW